jgi:hypothetical protein
MEKDLNHKYSGQYIDGHARMTLLRVGRMTSVVIL